MSPRTRLAVAVVSTSAESPTVSSNDKTRLDMAGHPHGEKLRVVERFRRRDFGHLDLEITMDDPKMYTKPFSIKVTHVLHPEADVLEYVCAENETDRAHMKLK